MIINLIRHSCTAGNLKSSYIGSTDESLCDEGRELIKKISYPDCTFLFASPMKRCMETASLIYGNRRIVTVDDFRECDFGLFEGKNYKELMGDPAYGEWLKGMGEAPFPGGEDPCYFKKRCTDAFEALVRDIDEDGIISLVIHGGTIMSLMEKYALPKKKFYEWHVKNACGYICEYKCGVLKVTGSIG